MSCYGLLTYYAILLPLHLGCCYSVASIRDVIDWSSRVTATYFPLFEFVGWSWSGEVGDGGRACWLCHHSRSNHIGVTSFVAGQKDMFRLRLTGSTAQPIWAVWSVDLLDYSVGFASWLSPFRCFDPWRHWLEQLRADCDRINRRVKRTPIF